MGVSARRIDPILAQANLTLGQVGSYAFCRGNAAAPGTTYAGSGMNYTGGVVETIASAVSVGTWRALGYCTVSDRGTLYVRIA